MTSAYQIERFETRAAFGRDEQGSFTIAPLRFGWRIRAANGEVILSSNQGHSRRIDRETVIGNFFAKVVQDQSLGFSEETGS